MTSLYPGEKVSVKPFILSFPPRDNPFPLSLDSASLLLGFWLKVLPKIPLPSLAKTLTPIMISIMTPNQEKSASSPEPKRYSIFDAATEEANRHKWFESEKAGRDLGDAAIRDWHKRYWRIFCRQCWIEHVQGERFWQELDNRDFGILQQRFHDNMDLVHAIVQKFRAGEENLNVIAWALEQKEKVAMEDVLAILSLLDINARRLSPAIEINEEEFVQGIKARHRTRALIVDDDRDTREMLQELLRIESMESMTATTGEEALEMVQTRRFDLFLIDIMLPGKHGAEVAWYLRRHGVKAPVVAISAVLDTWNEDDLYDCGFTHLIAKPFNLTAIRDLARSVIQKNMAQKG